MLILGVAIGTIGTASFFGLLHIILVEMEKADRSENEDNHKWVPPK